MSEINFEIIIKFDNGEQNIEISESLKDAEFPTDINQIKYFIIEYILLKYNISLKYESININIIRNNKKIHPNNDEFKNLF